MSHRTSSVRKAGAAVVEHRNATDEHRAGTRKFHIIQPVVVNHEHPVARPDVELQADRLGVLEDDRRRGRGRSPWAGRSCPTSRAPRADDRTEPARRSVARRDRRSGPPRASRPVAGRRVRVEVRDEHRPSQRRQGGTELVDDRRGDRTPCRRRRIRRRRSARSVRSGRSGRQALRPEIRRTATTRSHRGSRRRAGRRRLQGCSGSTAATRSPRRTPRRRSPVATAATWAVSSAPETAVSG